MLSELQPGFLTLNLLLNNRNIIKIFLKDNIHKNNLIKCVYKYSSIVKLMMVFNVYGSLFNFFCISPSEKLGRSWRWIETSWILRAEIMWTVHSTLSTR